MKRSIAPVVLLLVAVVLCSGILIALLSPAFTPDGGPARRSYCMHKLKQIALAMHDYHDVYNCLPPVVITDDQGTPRYSWRVAILPFIEQQALFNQWNPNEPWDSPNNRRIGQTVNSAYRCPSDADGDPLETNYVMITGEEAIGRLPNEVTQFADVIDGLSNTIMIVEVVDSGIGWSEPRDLSLDEVELRINAPGGISSRHPGGANVALCDGSMHFVPESTSAADLRAWITKGGGEAPPDF